MYKKILVIRFSSIGDIVVTTAAVRCIREKFPQAEIHYITKEKYAEVIYKNPYLNKIISYKNYSKEFKGELKTNDYDLIIDLHNNLRSRIISRGLGAKKIIRYHKDNFKKWLWVWFKSKPTNFLHTSERYFNTLKELGVEYDNHGLDYFNISHTNSLPFTDKPFAVAVLGGTYFTKKMPTYKWIELIQKTKLPFVLLGGPDEVIDGKKIEDACGTYVKSLCGQLTLAESAGIIEKSKCVVSHDTGLMHISAALKKPLISIWGNTIPEFGLYPLFPKALEHDSHIFEVKNLSCRPCSKLGKDTCPKKHFDCMTLQNTEVMSETVLKKF